MAYRNPDYANLTGEWWRPQKEGESLTGIFLGQDTKPSRFGGEQSFFGVRVRDGKERRVPVNVLLGRAFDAAGVRLGDGVRITFLGLRGQARGYKVEALPAEQAILEASGPDSEAGKKK